MVKGRFKRRAGERPDGKAVALQGDDRPAGILRQGGVNFSEVRGTGCLRDPQTSVRRRRAALVFAHRHLGCVCTHATLIVANGAPELPLLRSGAVPAWFGGGADLTPFYPSSTNASTFHSTLKSCDGINPALLPRVQGLV